MQEKHIRWIGIPVLGLIVPFLMKDILDDGEPYITHALRSIIFTFTFWQGGCTIFFRLRKVYPTFGETRERILWTVIYSFAYIIIAGSSVDLLLYYTGLNETSCLESWKAFFSKQQIAVTLTTIVGTIYEGTYLFQKWQEALLEAEKLKTQNIRSQFEVLKNQTSPHFLFNSLNTLISIIPENSQLAMEFGEKLAKVYRYILQNQEKELVKLKTELDFVESYIFLQKNRFGESLKFEIEIEDKFMNLQVAPLSLQMLVENAIKHNVIAQSKPLTIEIYINNKNTVVVKNNLQTKTAKNSTKLGLENIKKRYQYLSHKTVDIVKTNSSFIVELPLILPIKV